MSKEKSQILLMLLLVLGGCTSSSVMDLDANTVQVSAASAPICGPSGAQKLAIKNAAYQTLKRGFDKYVILNGRATSQQRLTGFTPRYANTTSSGQYYGNDSMGTYTGSSNTVITGGQPIVVTAHGQDVTVRMFHNSDPGAENAVDAKRVLGPDWQKIMAKGPGITCT